MSPGDLCIYGRARYRFVRAGCATNMASCPNGEHAATILPLDRRDQPKYGERGTYCVDIRGVSPL
jgi:hypothetical protein